MWYSLTIFSIEGKSKQKRNYKQKYLKYISKK